MFAKNMMGGMNFAFPDVCLTPTPVGPIPIPYPNIAVDLLTNPATAAMKVLIGGMPALNQGSMVMMSNGDNIGVVGGVVSLMVMGPCRFILGSLKTMAQGMPIQRLTSITAQNGMNPNMVGLAVVPSQVKVLVLG